MLDKFYALTSRLTLVTEDHKENWSLRYGNQLRNPRCFQRSQNTFIYNSTEFGQVRSVFSI